MCPRAACLQRLVSDNKQVVGWDRAATRSKGSDSEATGGAPYCCTRKVANFGYRKSR
jgi:hypothetical protein